MQQFDVLLLVGRSEHEASESAPDSDVSSSWWGELRAVGKNGATVTFCVQPLKEMDGKRASTLTLIFYIV